MNEVPLQNLVAEKGQAAVAKALGVSPAAICKAVQADREIYVSISTDGTFVAKELRPFPSQAAGKRDVA